MATAVAVLASLGFISWLIYRGMAKKTVKAHNIAYGISVITGLSTYAFFLGMDDIPQLFKIVLSIMVGVALLFIAAYLQRRRAGSQ